MRESFRYLAAGLSLLIAAGCSENTNPVSAPSRSMSVAAPKFDYSAGGSFGDQSTEFTVTSRGGSYSVAGLFSVNFPANSVCAPSRSTYGEGEWDKPCSTLSNSESVRITAKLRLTSTGLAVDFSPALRFNPQTQVTISTDIFAPVIRNNADFFRANPGTLRGLAVTYSATLGGASVSDYVLDPSVVTRVGLTSGRIWRRIKHFSGYVIATGEACTPAPDFPDCIEIMGDG
jgi:hypothetical protein